MKSCIYILLSSMLSLLAGCSSKNNINPSTGSTIGYIEFKVDNVLYRAEASEHNSSASVNNTSVTHRIFSHYNTDDLARQADLSIRIRYQNQFTTKNYEFTPATEFDTYVELQYKGEKIFSSDVAKTSGNLEITKFEAKSYGIVEGRFNLKNIKISDGTKSISDAGIITEGKFQIRLDEDWDQ